MKKANDSRRMISDRPTARDLWLKLLATLALCLLTLGLSMSNYLRSQMVESERVFRRQGVELDDHLRQHFAANNAVISAITGFYHATPQLPVSALSQFANEILSNHPHVYSIEYFERVTADERQALEADMHDQGYYSFQIQEHLAGRHWQRAAERDVYMPITFMEPLEPHTARVLGFDGLSHPILRKGIETAIASGQTVITEPYPLTEGGRAIFALRAVYKGSGIPMGVSERQRQANGVFALVLFDLHLHEVLSEFKPLRIDSFTLSHRGFLSNDEQGQYLHFQAVGDNPARPSMLSHLILLSNMEQRFNYFNLNYPIELVLHYRPSWRHFDLERGVILFSSGAFLTVLLLLAVLSYHRRRLEQWDTRRALFLEKERAEVTLHAIVDGVITTDVNGTIDYINRTAADLTGWPREQALGKPLKKVFDLRYEGQDEAKANAIDDCLASGNTFSLNSDAVLYRQSGEAMPVETNISAMRDHQRQVIGVVVAFNDVTRERELASQMAYQARHDVLTGLVNRRAFEDLLHQCLNNARAGLGDSVLAYMDLDQFKIVNDTCGHTAGDELLKQLSVLMRGKVRDSDAFGRLGGDEFGLLLSRCPMEQARRVIDDLRQAVGDYRFAWEGKRFEVGVSIGLVAINAESGSLSDLMRAADAACYMAKEQGRNRAYIYQPDDEELSHRAGQMQWIHRIQVALEKQRLNLARQLIQPIDANSGLAPHYELLVRMVDEDGEIIPPGAFIPAAERFGVMPAIDQWVLKTALARLKDEADDDTVYNINVSGHSLADEMFLEFVTDSINASGIAPGRICFEITETAVIANLNQARSFISALKTLGCMFALDDFGSGLSSFAYLKNLQVDFLKIDGGFVRDMVHDQIDFAMVHAINDIGRVMDIRTIAEFVENDEILRLLANIGVDYAQGFGVARPEDWA